MKRKMDEDEWYPVYSLDAADSYGGYEVEVTEEQVARWSAAEDAFKQAQAEMGDLHEAAEELARAKAAAEKVEREAAEKAARAERQREAEAASRKRRAAVDKMVGTVYDAEGNPVGQISEGITGLKVVPIVD